MAERPDHDNSPSIGHALRVAGSPAKGQPSATCRQGADRADWVDEANLLVADNPVAAERGPMPHQHLKRHIDHGAGQVRADHWKNLP
jgi:hypothetical protein